MMEVCEVIDELSDEKPPIVMENFVNDEHKNSIRKYFVEKNDTEITDKVRQTSIWIEKEYVLHRDMTDNKTEKNGYPKRGNR